MSSAAAYSTRPSRSTFRVRCRIRVNVEFRLQAATLDSLKLFRLKAVLQNRLDRRARLDSFETMTQAGIQTPFVGVNYEDAYYPDLPSPFIHQCPGSDALAHNHQARHAVCENVKGFAVASGC